MEEELCTKEHINLTGKEFDLLLFLITNPSEVFDREYLLQKIWGYEYYGDLRTVDVHIRRLREKIEMNSSSPRYILTKWGKGYYFKKINKNLFSLGGKYEKKNIFYNYDIYFDDIFN